MKNLKSTATIIAIILSSILFQSCGSTPEKVEDKQLSSFMLGGIYFINGYGGTSNISSMMIDRTTNEQLISGYKEIFEFAFETSQASGIKSMFSSMWEISNKEDLVACLADLKTREHKYKAWDYARIINNASMGYAAGYLTKEEVKTTIEEILPLAQAKYKSWDNYYEDFNKGRLDWNANDPDGAAFEKIAKEISTFDKSIYKVLPLNTTE